MIDHHHHYTPKDGIREIEIARVKKIESFIDHGNDAEEYEDDEDDDDEEDEEDEDIEDDDEDETMTMTEMKEIMVTKQVVKTAKSNRRRMIMMQQKESGPITRKDQNENWRTFGIQMKKPRLPTSQSLETAVADLEELSRSTSQSESLRAGHSLQRSGSLVQILNCLGKATSDSRPSKYVPAWNRCQRASIREHA